MGNNGQKWRKDGDDAWDDKTVLKLRNEINKCLEGVQSLQHIEIILCGGTGEGKSSLINNCMAALTGHYCIIARHGAGDHQVTKQYKRVQAWTDIDGSTRNVPLTFSDTRGFSESSDLGAPVEAIKACILGKVRHNEPIEPKITNQQWSKRPTVKCKSSYTFVVADATIVPDDADPVSAKSKTSVYLNLREIQNFSLNEGLKVAAFLTMCDKLDPKIKSDVRYLHYSRLVEKKVKAFHKMTGIPESRIFPIMNYTSEIRVTPGMAIQTLIALKVCLEDIKGALWAEPNNRN